MCATRAGTFFAGLWNTIKALVPPMIEAGNGDLKI